MRVSTSPDTNGLGSRSIALIGAALILCALLLGAAISIWGTSALDTRLSLSLAFLREGSGTDLWLFLTWLGDKEVRVVAGLLVVAWLALAGRWRWGLLLLSTAAVETLANSGLKLFFARARPDLLPHLDPVSSLSFPSGHAAHSAALYLMIGLILAARLEGRAAKRLAIGAALILVALIGVSRIVLGVHWPTDVLGGWAFGSGCALLGWTVGSGRRFRLDRPAG